jgi:hypothetical protein
VRVGRPGAGIALGSLAVAFVALVALGCDDCFGRGTGEAPPGAERRVDTAAVVVAAGADAGSATFILDDGTTLRIVEPTPLDDACAAPDAVGCVLLADTFGDAVIWYALRDPDPLEPTRRLALPGPADMRDSGDTAVLGNGWLVALATPTLRTCDEPSPSLRAFIDRWGVARSEARLDLETDEIVEVVCRPDAG